MTNPPRILLLILCLTTLFLTGCARNKELERRVSMMQNQVLALTNEVASLSDSQRALDQSLSSMESRQRRTESSPRQTLATDKGQAAASITKTGGVTVKDGIYRTPSGFELPVRSIQTALKNAGYYNGNVDGRIGPLTEEAITRFQGDHGLETDGIVGRNTWDKLQQFA